MKSLVLHWTDYCGSTSVHGFPYLVNARGAWEQLLWLAVLGSGFTLAGLIIKSGFE